MSEKSGPEVRKSSTYPGAFKPDSPYCTNHDLQLLRRNFACLFEVLTLAPQSVLCTYSHLYTFMSFKSDHFENIL